MRISMSKGAMLKAVSTVSVVAERRAHMEWLSCLLVSAKDESAAFEAMGVNESARMTSEALVEEEGSALVPAGALKSILRAMPDGAVELKAGAAAVSISCGGSCFDVPALDPEVFTRWEGVEAHASVVLESGLFSDAARAVISAAPKKDQGEEMSRVLVRIRDQSATLVGYDGRRAQIRRFDADSQDDLDIIVPVGFLSCVRALSSSSPTIALGIGEHRIQADIGSLSLASRRLEGQYPRFESLFERMGTISVTSDALALKGAAHRMSAIRTPGSAVTVSASAGATELALVLDTPQHGSAFDAVPCSRVPAEAVLYLNAETFFGAVSSLESGEAELVFADKDHPFSPLTIKQERGTAFLMPLSKKPRRRDGMRGGGS